MPVPTQLTPQPARTSTPTRAINGHDPVSRPSSTAPDANPAILHTAIPHGAPARRYLNEKVTGVLLEGMKNLARDQLVFRLVSVPSISLRQRYGCPVLDVC